jgi:hypothetical protein
MRVTAGRRVEGILSNSRRRHYGHAAIARASCVGSAPAGRNCELAPWAAERASTVLASSRVQGRIDAGLRASRIGSAQLTGSRSGAIKNRSGRAHSGAHSRRGSNGRSHECSRFHVPFRSVPKSVPTRSPETRPFPEHFDEGGFTKTVAFGSTKLRSSRCWFRVYLPFAVRWPSGRRRRFAKPL